MRSQTLCCQRQRCVVATSLVTASRAADDVENIARAQLLQTCLVSRQLGRSDAGVAAGWRALVGVCALDQRLDSVG